MSNLTSTNANDPSKWMGKESFSKISRLLVQINESNVLDGQVDQIAISLEKVQVVCNNRITKMHHSIAPKQCGKTREG